MPARGPIPLLIGLVAVLIGGCEVLQENVEKVVLVFDTNSQRPDHLIRFLKIKALLIFSILVKYLRFTCLNIIS